MSVAELIERLLVLYAGVGLFFAIVFVLWGVQRIDASARGSGLGFRLIILPGCLALWPLLLLRWVAGRAAPQEKNAHRSAASAR